MSGVDVYPVGLVSDLRTLRYRLRSSLCVKHGPSRGCSCWPPHHALRAFARAFRQGCRRRSYWNGYLAEPDPWPEGLRSCGHGWTRRRALARLWEYQAEHQPVTPVGRSCGCIDGIWWCDAHAAYIDDVP